MCGILFYKKSEVNEIPDTTMLKIRGPDAYNEKSIGDYHFIFSRLAIICKENKGIQPINLYNWNIICNGEIFNYLTLCDIFGIDKNLLESDIDIMLHLGVDNIYNWASKLNGDFSAILYNSITCEYYVIRDPIGVRPLYVGYNKNKEPIAYSSVLAPISFCDSFEEFPPGNIYSSKNNIYIKYHSFNLNNYKFDSKDFVKKMIYSQLYESVYIRMVHTNVPIAFLCSGGIDSSILLTIGTDIWTNRLGKSKNDLHCFTIEFIDTQCPSSDAFYATNLANELGINHTVFSFTKQDIIENLEDILDVLETNDYKTVRASIPQYFLAKYISINTNYKVIISGEGADELFLGYNYMSKCPSGRDAENESERLINQIYKYDVLRADRTMSSWGLELRVPFLDINFVECVFNISGELRNTNKEKEILREAFEDYKVLKNTRILERNKEKFSDGCGLSYIPNLLKIMASFYGINDCPSVHLLETYEKKYVSEYYKFHGKITDKLKERKLPN
uniref:asparagine synthase (glutamine-hydrolyzing) n=1 Tax=viral metagenome TaxID=1070528 RepID=A0A6C0H4R7_9ZZZZ